MTSGPAHWHCRIGRVTRRENVHALPWVYNPLLAKDSQPNTAVVQLLEELLVDAKAGRLHAIAAGTVMAGEFTSHCWARGFGQTAHQLMAAVADLDFALRRDRFEAHQCPHVRPPDGSA